MASLINLPKMGDYGDMMRRGAIQNKVAIANEDAPPMSNIAQRLACPNTTLRLPSIPPGPGPEMMLMVEGAKELGQKIAVQQRTAEKFNQEAQKDRTLQLEAPRNAMEEYFVAMLARLRRKEIEEANNAYLTQQQKNDLASEALRVKASMPGGLVQAADQRAEEEMALDAMDDDDDAEAMAEEARMAASSSSSSLQPTADPGDIATMTSAPTPTDLEEVNVELAQLFGSVSSKFKAVERDTGGRQQKLDDADTTSAVSQIRNVLNEYKGRGLTPTEIKSFEQRLRRVGYGKIQEFKSNPVAYLDRFRMEIVNKIQSRLLDAPAGAAAAAAAAGMTTPQHRRFFRA